MPALKKPAPQIRVVLTLAHFGKRWIVEGDARSVSTIFDRSEGEKPEEMTVVIRVHRVKVKTVRKVKR